jgi:MerR HTH family regulatory protein
MQKEELIPAQEFCNSHQLEVSFIYSLQQYGLLEITTIEETIYLPASQLLQAEKIASLYAELGINMEGIDAITHLLQRVENMQDEITALKNKLSLYEGNI